MNQTQFEEQTQSLYRLRSARNKRRALIEDRDKSILPLDREERKLWAIMHSQIRYLRRFQVHDALRPSFTLAAEYCSPRNESKYRRVLQVLNGRLAPSSRQAKLLAMQEGSFRDHLLQMLTLSENEWKAAAFTTNEAALFELRKFREQEGYAVRYRIAAPDRLQLQLQLEPDTSTHTVEWYSAIRSRLTRIEAFFRPKAINGRRNKLRDTKWHDQFINVPLSERREMSRFKRTPLHRLLAEAQSSI